MTGLRSPPIEVLTCTVLSAVGIRIQLTGLDVHVPLPNKLYLFPTDQLEPSKLRLFDGS